MINSISKELQAIVIPSFNGEIKMLPFDLKSLSEIPQEFKELIRSMIEVLPQKQGIAYLTVDGKVVEKNTTQRRGGAHIDGNYLPSLKWGSGNGGGNGWKVGEGGRSLSSKEHKLSYQSTTGGMIIASNYPGCKGWNGKFNNDPGIGGDCTHLNDLGEGFILKPNTIYYGNSQFIHESLPIDKTVHRTLVRITLPMDYPVLRF
jgi:hypothetical protein